MMKSDLFSAKCLKEFISQKMIENQQPKNMVLHGEILKRESCFRFIKLGLSIRWSIRSTILKLVWTFFNIAAVMRQNKLERCLEALPVDNGWAAFVVFLLGDPHLLEGGEGSQDGATDPDGVFPLRRSNDLDLNGGGSQGSDLLLHSVSNTRVHGGATRHDGVGVQVLPDVNIALHDGVVGGLMDTAGFHTQEGRLEEGLRG